MRMVLTVLAAMLIGLTAHARLGETEAQLLERFGKPWKRGGMKPPAEGKGFVWHMESGMGVSAWLYNEKASWIEYYARGASSQLTSTEVKNILDANAEGYTWTQWKPGSKEWVRSDKKAVAEVLGNRVTVYDVEFAKAAKAAFDKAVADLEAEEAARQAEIKKRREERQAGGTQATPATTDGRVNKF